MGENFNCVTDNVQVFSGSGDHFFIAQVDAEAGATKKGIALPKGAAKDLIAVLTDLEKFLEERGAKK